MSAAEGAAARKLYQEADRLRVVSHQRVGPGDLEVELEPGAPPGQLWLRVTCHPGQERRTRVALARLRARAQQERQAGRPS